MGMGYENEMGSGATHVDRRRVPTTLLNPISGRGKRP
jgi:hypothetical protein